MPRGIEPVFEQGAWVRIGSVIGGETRGIDGVRRDAKPQVGGRIDLIAPGSKSGPIGLENRCRSLALCGFLSPWRARSLDRGGFVDREPADRRPGQHQSRQPLGPRGLPLPMSTLCPASAPATDRETRGSHPMPGVEEGLVGRRSRTICAGRGTDWIKLIIRWSPSPSRDRPAVAGKHQRNHQRNRVDSSDLVRRMRQERQERAAGARVRPAETHETSAMQLPRWGSRVRIPSSAPRTRLRSDDEAETAVAGVAGSNPVVRSSYAASFGR
jgi:hypothetical protein